MCEGGGPTGFRGLECRPARYPDSGLVGATGQPICPSSSSPTPGLLKVQPEAWCYHLRNETPPQ